MKIKSIAANQTEVLKSNGDQVFISYETPVAAIIGGVSYRSNVKYSTTTTRHVNKWLGNGGKNAIIKPQQFFDDLI